MKTTLNVACLLAIVLALGIAAKAAAQTVYVRTPAGAYAYGYAPYPYGVYNPRRAYRQATRYGYPAAVYAGPRVSVSVGVYGVPYYGYPYHPLYGPLPQAQVPTPAAPQTRPQAPPAESPEPIPTPASEPEPREL
jgi:hypothetical protein